MFRMSAAKGLGILENGSRGGGEEDEDMDDCDFVFMQEYREQRLKGGAC